MLNNVFSELLCCEMYIALLLSLNPTDRFVPRTRHRFPARSLHSEVLYNTQYTIHTADANVESSRVGGVY